MHWGEAPSAEADPNLPEGAARLADVVDAPRELSRRLAQIGVVDAADGARLQALLKPGQRLVSWDGGLWRWDGYTASADAPTPAAQRLAQKNRLAELDGEAVEATKRVRAAEEALAAGETAVREAVERERAAREAQRSAQRALSDARTALAEAEKLAQVGELWQFKVCARVGDRVVAEGQLVLSQARETSGAGLE